MTKRAQNELRDKKPANSANALFLEAVHQSCAIRALSNAERHGEPISYAGDMNAGKRRAKAAAEAAVTGLRPGAPDVRVYLGGGRIKIFELKTEKRLSQQRAKKAPCDVAIAGL